MGNTTLTIGFKSEFSTVHGLINFFHSQQHPHTTTILPCRIAKHKATTRMTFEDTRAIFNQIQLTSYLRDPLSTNITQPIITPTVKTMISTPVKPTAPAQTGKMRNNPYYADWKAVLFQDYHKILNSGTWSAPILRSQIPPNKAILPPRVTFKVKRTDVNNTYELFCRTCTNGSAMEEDTGYTNSYSLVGSIDSLCLILSIATSKHWVLNILDISNAFQKFHKLLPK